MLSLKQMLIFHEILFREKKVQKNNISITFPLNLLKRNFEEKGGTIAKRLIFD